MTTVCKRLYALGNTSSSLWDDIAEYIEGPEEAAVFAAWLHSKRHVLKELVIQPGARLKAQDVLNIVTSLAGSTIELFRLGKSLARNPPVSIALLFKYSTKHPEACCSNDLLVVIALHIAAS